MITKRTLIFVAIIVFVIGVVGFAAYVLRGDKGIPFVAERDNWSIGIYRGDSPFHFDHEQDKVIHVMRAEDVTDVPAKFVADPFLIFDHSTWYLFFEVYNEATDQGDLAVATSHDSRRWTYERVVLDEPFHLSYPYVFIWDDEYFMIPETFEAKAVRLYRAVDFPYEWSFVTTLIEGQELVDSSVAYFEGHWWMFSSETGNDTLRLYHSDELKGPWQEHPNSPIVKGDRNIARPGGRALIYDGRLYRYAQDGDPTYGNQIWAFEITELTTTSYRERLVSSVPVLKATGDGWYGQAIHNIDPIQLGDGNWIASVDGSGRYFVYGLKY